MVKVLAVLTTLTGQLVGVYQLDEKPTMEECQHRLAEPDIADHIAALEREANLDVDFSEPHVTAKGECR
jgi:hypothetical protein